MASPDDAERIGTLDVDALSAWVVASVGARFREVERAYEENRAAALQLMDENKELTAELERLRQREAALRELVDRQAEDPGLWFMARTAPEAYLQQELRKLHDAVERGRPAQDEQS